MPESDSNEDLPLMQGIAGIYDDRLEQLKVELLMDQESKQ